MVVSNYPYWPRILKQIGKLLAAIFVLSIIAFLIDMHGHILSYVTIPEVAVTILGAALTILLGFRTNSAYGRWWEARTLWGALVNNSRSLARQAVSFSHLQGSDAAGSSGFARDFVYRQIAFVHAVRCSLRRQPPWDEIQPFLDTDTVQQLKAEQNVPAAILMSMGKRLADAVRQHVIDQWQMQRMDTTLSELSNILGACERIKNTPLPRQYDYYPELFIKIYCTLLPFVIVDEVGLWTPLITVVVGFVFLVLNRIGKNLEDPFENRPYDVPLTSLSRTIEINLRQALGEKDVPAPVQPVGGVMW